jgi:hypothetical protein
MDSHLKGTRDAHCTSVRWGGEIQKVQDKRKEEVTCGGYRTCGPITIIGCTSDTPLIHPFHPNLEAAIEDLKGGHLERCVFILRPTIYTNITMFGQELCNHRVSFRQQFDLCLELSSHQTRLWPYFRHGI